MSRAGYAHEKNQKDPLYLLLIDACPPCVKQETRAGRVYYKRDPKKGTKSLRILAYFLGMTPWGVHKWIRTRRIPAAKVLSILELSGGKLKLRHFAPYVFGQSTKVDL